MGGRARIGTILAAILIFGASMNAAPAASPDKAASQAKQSLDLQTDLPIVKKVEPYTSQPSTNRRMSDFGQGSQVVFWIAAIVALGLVGWMLVQSTWGVSRARKLKGANGEEEVEGIVRRGEETILEADDWVRRGNLMEAMRVLLARSLNEMRLRLDLSIAASLTSREILQYVSLPKEARMALANIVDRVELAYFGDYPASASDYDSCRTSFETLVQALRTRARL